MDNSLNTAGQPVIESPGLPPSFEDMRAAQRFALLMRTAKLVGESGEYLCIVRDVSATGLRLKLFHPLPPDDRMAIELANGEYYFIEKVWERDDHAGFRFPAPIEVHQFINESSPWPRRPVRLRIELPALVIADGVTTLARVRDLSQHGCRIESSRHLAVEQRVKITAEGLPPLIANVCWRSSPDYGLVFQQSFAFDQLARLAASLQLAGIAQPARPAVAVN